MKFMRYLDGDSFAKAVEDFDKEGYGLHSWNVVQEIFEQSDGRGGTVSWPATVVYALFFPVKKPEQPKPIGCR